MKAAKKARTAAPASPTSPTVVTATTTTATTTTVPAVKKKLPVSIPVSHAGWKSSEDHKEGLKTKEKHEVSRDEHGTEKVKHVFKEAVGRVVEEQRKLKQERKQQEEAKSKAFAAAAAKKKQEVEEEKEDKEGGEEEGEKKKEEEEEETAATKNKESSVNVDVNNDVVEEVVSVYVKRKGFPILPHAPKKQQKDEEEEEEKKEQKPEKDVAVDAEHLHFKKEDLEEISHIVVLDEPTPILKRKKMDVEIDQMMSMYDLPDGAVLIGDDQVLTREGETLPLFLFKKAGSAGPSDFNPFGGKAPAFGGFGGKGAGNNGGGGLFGAGGLSENTGGGGFFGKSAKKSTGKSAHDIFNPPGEKSERIFKVAASKKAVPVARATTSIFGGAQQQQQQAFGNQGTFDFNFDEDQFQF